MAVDENLDSFLKDSFKNGRISRELRLSKEEIEHLKRTFPKASIKQIQTSQFSDDKIWVNVKLKDF